MDVTQIEYDRDTTSLPDKHGTLVAVGDFVRNDKGEIWRVYELRPRQAYGDHPGDFNGMLDYQYSGLGIERPVKFESMSDWMIGVNFEPKMQSSVSLPNAERVDDSKLVTEFERILIENAWKIIAVVEGRLAAKRSELQRREAVLERESR